MGNKHRKRWQHNWENWEKHGRSKEWGKGPSGVRAGLFLWFLFMFGTMALLLLGGIGALIYVGFTTVYNSDYNIFPYLLGGCGLFLLIPLLFKAVGGRGFSGVAVMADVMDASDKVAEGDFTVRVSEHGRRGRFGRLAYSFNKMTAALERSDEQRRNLTADVAHELRTPLHIIQGNLEGILDGVYKPTSDHIQATLEETHTLARLVNDLHTLAQAEAGQLTIRHELVDVTELLADVQTSFSGQADIQQIDLTTDFEGKPADLTIEGDAGRLNQVLSNLVANSLRHTESGGQINLFSHRENGRVHIQIRDNGSGIAEDDLPFIFDRFWRGDQARTRSDGSSGGLGLAIVKQLVEAHNGRVNVQSQLGKGTTFTLIFPIHHTPTSINKTNNN